MNERANARKRIPYIRYLLHIAVVAGVIVAAVSYVDWPEVMDALGHFNIFFVPPLLIISTLYIFLKGWRFIRLMRPVTDLPGGILFRGFVAGTAATILPGGVVARAGLMRQVGVPIANSSGAVFLSSVLDQIAFILGTMVSSIWFQAARLPAFIILLLLLPFILAFRLQSWRRWISKAVHWVLTKLSLRSHWLQFKQAWKVVATPRIILITFGMTLVCVSLQVIMLDFSLRGVGLLLPYPLLFLAYILPAMIGRNSIFPGGFGIIEVGMVGFLNLTADVDINLGTAAIAVYRVVSVVFQTALGGLFYFFAWQGENEPV